MPGVFVITGPSGVGKGTLIRLLRERVPELALSVSATTRQARPGETQGEHYHFISDEEFARHVEAGDFVEWAEYSGRRYGTLREELERHTSGGRPVLLEIEVQGARQVRETLPDAVADLHPPAERRRAARSPRRPRHRRPPSRSSGASSVAEQELAAAGEFEHVVVNDRLDAAVEQLEAIVRGTLDP